MNAHNDDNGAGLVPLDEEDRRGQRATASCLVLCAGMLLVIVVGAMGWWLL